MEFFVVVAHIPERQANIFFQQKLLYAKYCVTLAGVLSKSNCLNWNLYLLSKTFDAPTIVFSLLAHITLYCYSI